MNNFFSLVKVEFLSQLGLNKILHSKKNKRLSGISGLCFFALLMIGMIAFIGYVYSDMFAIMLAPMERIDELLPLMLAISCLLSFVLSFYTSANVLYGYKDYDLLMSMPIKPVAIVLSKLVFIYVFDLIFAVLIVVPSLVVYSSYVSLTVGLILTVALMTVFSPFLPTALSLFLGALIAFISSRFRKKNIAQIIMYLLFFIACFGVGFLSGAEMIDPTAIIGKIYFIMPWAVKGLSQPLFLGLYLLVNLLPFLAISLVCAITYKKMNSLITAKKRTKEFRLKTYGGKTPFGALLSREVSRLFSNATYTMNALIGPILGVIMSIAFAIIIKTILGVFVPELVVIFPAVFAFAFMMAPPTNCSVSLEGKPFWIVKTAPVSSKSLLNAKLMVNVIFTAVPAFISGVASMIIIGAPYYVVMLLTFISTAIALLGGAIGLIFNLLFPSLNWENEVKAIKQSLSVFLSILVSLFFAAGLFVLGFFLSINYVYILLIVTGLLLLLNIVGYWFIYSKGEKLLAKI